MKKILLTGAFALFGTFAMAGTTDTIAKVKFFKTEGVCVISFVDRYGKVLWTETHNTSSADACERLTRMRLAQVQGQ